MISIRAWLFWRLPRLWMNRTQYAFWVIGQRERLAKKANADRILVDREGVAYPTRRDVKLKARPRP
jgi:hypothetical protein